jgi:hypothetical protein
MAEMNILFKKADGYKMIPVTGAWGVLIPKVRLFLIYL